MSGSGGGGVGGGGSQPSACETLRFDAQLVSTQPTLIATLQLGNVLDIDLAVLKGQTVVQVLSSGQVAGGLTGLDASRLRACIEDGHVFKATVLKINGGQVRVRIEHA